jgi:CBS domain-containing protein
MGLSEFDEAYEDEEKPRESEERRLGEAILNASIRDLDPRPALSLPEDAPLEDAVRMMRDARIGAVLLTRDDRPVGIFTERDILRRVVLTGISQKTPLRELMTTGVETLGIDDNVGFALNRMILGGFRHIPVTDDSGRAVGVLSQREIVAFVVSLLPSRILNLPPEPHLQAHSEDGG